MATNFKIRTIAGGGGSVIVGGEVTTFEVEDVRSHSRKMYTYVGGGFGIGARSGGSGPSTWTEFKTRKNSLSERSFQGWVAVTSGGSAVGVGAAFINLEWLTGEANGEAARGIGVTTGLGIGIQGNWGYMKLRK